MKINCLFFTHGRRLFFLVIVATIIPLAHWHVSKGIISNAQNTDSEFLSPTLVADTYVTKGHPDQSRADEIGLWVGHSKSRTDNATEKTLLKFDLSGIITDSTITSATLALYLAGWSGDDMDVSIKRVTGDWQENITWNESSRQLTEPSGDITATVLITSVEKWFYWDAKPIISQWLKDPDRGKYLSLILTGSENLNDQERGFWSGECAPSECNSRSPNLSIGFVPPTPTPIPPTPTIPPTPGISSLTLRADPTGEINHGGQVTYTISYQNGTAPIFGVSIENVIPTQLELITDSFTSTGDAFSGTPTIQAGRITWGAIGSLPGKALGSVSYRAQRPTLTATSTTIPTVTSTTSPTATSTTTPTITSTITPTATSTTTPTITSTITPTVTGTTTPTMAIPTSTVSVTPIPTVSATPTPTSSGTPGASQITVEVVAIPKDPQNFDYFGSLGMFSLDDAVPDDSDTIPKLMTFTWDNPAIPMMVSQKAMTNWTNVQFTCYPSISSSIQASAQSVTAILSANANLYCVFINVRSDQQNLASTQATVASIVAAVSQGTVVSTPVPTIPPPTLEPIINQGATMFWTYPLGNEIKPGSISSNSTQNPSIQIYLPIIGR